MAIGPPSTITYEFTPPPPDPARRWALIGVGVTVALLVGVFALLAYAVSRPGNGDEKIAELPADARLFSAAKTMDCGVTDAGLEQLAREHPDIEIISLTQCPQVTNEGVKHVGRLKSLKELTLQGRHGFDELALQYLRGCEKLEELGLAGVDIGEQGARYIVELPNLKSLDLSRDHVSDEAMRILEQRRTDIGIRWF